MAASRTPATADPAPCIAVAYSGGRDSTALLHATATAAAKQGVSVWALHVHHGLSPQADAWLEHATQQCRQWAAHGLPVQLSHRRLSGRPARGESIEAWARRERYRALQAMAGECGASAVLLAHHRQDQAETLLLQALRGAGVAGLAAMPTAVERDGLWWMRPWLAQPRALIETYVQQHRLAHIEDDSNTDVRYARNRLRHAVWPALTGAFPQAEESLADVAAWAAQASSCLADLATIDWLAVGDGERLNVLPWRDLSVARQSNVLRAWLRRCTGQLPSSSLLQRLVAELPAARRGQWDCPPGVLRLHRGRLGFEPAPASTPRPAEAPALETSLYIVRAGRYALPGWGGVLEVRRVREGGVPVAWVAQLELRAREGGERYMAGVARPARSLKKQFQSAEVPAWLRDGPLLFSGGQLVFVPGLGLDARVLAAPGQPQFALTWRRA